MWRFSHAVVARSSGEARVWAKRVPSSLKRAWARDQDSVNELDLETSCSVPTTSSCCRRKEMLQFQRNTFGCHFQFYY